MPPFLSELCPMQSERITPESAPHDHDYYEMNWRFHTLKSGSWVYNISLSWSLKIFCDGFSRMMERYQLKTNRQKTSFTRLGRGHDVGIIIHLFSRLEFNMIWYHLSFLHLKALTRCNWNYMDFSIKKCCEYRCQYTKLGEIVAVVNKKL